MWRRIWCYLRNHPYDWEPIMSEDEWRMNSLPPQRCSNCGCTKR